MAATFCEVWSSVAALIAELDVLAGFADLATSDPTRPYCKPDILELDDGDIELKVITHEHAWMCLCCFWGGGGRVVNVAVCVRKGGAVPSRHTSRSTGL